MESSRSHLRLTDAEREAAMGRLSEHFAVGRLDKDEFDERSDAIWSAKTQGQLAPIFADLPQDRTATRAPGARPSRARSGLPMPWVPVLVVLIGLSVVTHLPFWLLAMFGWCFAGQRHCHPRRSRLHA